MNSGQLRELRKEMGMLFQGSALFDFMPVLKNVMFPLEMFSNMTQKEKEERAKFCLQCVNLDPSCFNLYPSEISGGMQKRVAIARAIALKPRYLFCDEPNSGLDPFTSLGIDRLIHDITVEFNMITVVNTHDMNSVMEIGDNIVFIQKGHKEWQGSSANIFNSGNQYLDEFVFASNVKADSVEKTCMVLCVIYYHIVTTYQRVDSRNDTLITEVELKGSLLLLKCCQTTLQLLKRRNGDKDGHHVRAMIHYLFGALHLNLQHHVLALIEQATNGSFGGAVKIAVVFGVFQKAIFFNGAQGDVNHVNVNAKGGDFNDTYHDFDDVDRGYGHARHMGNVVAAAVLQVFDKVNYTDVDSLRLDAVKHISYAFFPGWLDMLRRYKNREIFAVGEYWLNDLQELLEYLDNTQHSIAILHTVNQHAQRDQIEDLLKGLVLKNHLAINTVKVFSSAKNFALYV